MGILERSSSALGEKVLGGTPTSHLIEGHRASREKDNETQNFMLFLFRTTLLSFMVDRRGKALG
jgi:hypothetical protein